MVDEIPGGAPADNSTRQAAMFCHLGGILGIIGAFIVWQLKKDTSPFVDAQGKEAVNLQINVLLAWLVCAILMWIPVVGWVFRILLLLVMFGNWALVILAAVKINEGQNWRYPLPILRLVE